MTNDDKNIYSDLLSSILGDDDTVENNVCQDVYAYEDFENIDSSEEEYNDVEGAETDDPDSVSSDKEEMIDIAESSSDTEDTVSEEPRRVGMFKFKKNNNKNRINTTSIFDNTNFFNGGMGSEEVVSNAPLAISPIVEDQYDYSVAEDIVLLQDRKETTQIIYEIYTNAPFSNLYKDKNTGIVKIPKEDIPKVFYYVKDKLLKRKKVSAFETVIAINEFFEFNYDYIIKKVVSSKMMSEILEDYYQNMGMKERIDEMSANPLF